MNHRRSILVVTILLAFSVAGALYAANRTAHAPGKTSSTTASTAQSETSTNTTTKPTYDTTSSSSIQVIVNKQHPLNPIDYAPSSLTSVGNGQQMRTEAAEAFLKMQSAAAAANAPIAATSGYRSYSYQQTIYGGYVTQDGAAEADTYSARPGYSEHQTGLAIDIQGGGCSLDNCFEDTAQGEWLALNAYKYGFLLRYPADKTAITGYEHEAWHFRYIGVELATAMHDENVTTLEEYFGVSGGTTYEE